MKRPFLVGGLAAAVSVILALVWGNSQPAHSRSEEHGAPQAVSVEVVQVKAEFIPRYEELPGRINAFEIADIRPQVTGIIKERLFVEGSQVEAGQQLYQIDPAPFEAAYRSGEADLQKARANVKSLEAKASRYEELVKIEAVSKQDYDDLVAQLAQARADVAIAEAALEAAKINLGYTKVYAPISGRIGKSYVTKGALVTANQNEPLAIITKLDPIYVDMVQSGPKLVELRASLSETEDVPVELLLGGDREPYPLRGTLQFMDVTVDESTSSVQLRAIFPNPDRILLPGMFVRARLRTGDLRAIRLPQRAAFRGIDGALRVWVVDEANTASQQVVEARQALEDDWLVTKGLQGGETIVVSGIQKLFPGTVVTPQPFVARSETEQPRHG